MGTVTPWKHLLLSALESNSHIKHSSFFQFATTGSNGRPSNRTVVFRGFEENSDRIQINTDFRTRKIEELKHCPFAEICWYFTDSWEQFRISGRVDVIDGPNSDPAKLQFSMPSNEASACLNLKFGAESCPWVVVAVGFQALCALLSASCNITLPTEKKRPALRASFPALCASLLSITWRCLEFAHFFKFMMQQREKSWFASSLKSRLQYLGPNPGLPCLSEQSPNEFFLDPSSGPVATFCLLVLDPDQVDYLDLKSNQRIVSTWSRSANGDMCWNSEMIHP